MVWAYWTQADLLASLRGDFGCAESALGGNGNGDDDDDDCVPGGGGGGGGGGGAALATSCASYIAAAVARTSLQAVVDGNLTVDELSRRHTKRTVTSRRRARRS